MESSTPSDPRRWLALSVVLTAAFLAILDFFIVNVSIPAIQRGLHASYGQVQFVIAGYGLAYAVGLITGGRLGDIYGRKRVFMLGMGGFTLASTLCGFAPSPDMLVISRIFQGLMAALMFPQVLSAIQVSFPPKEKGLAFGMLGVTMGMASIAAQLLGGLLIQANLLGLGWRPVFLVNVPIGIVALLAAVPLVRESRSPTARKLDLIGAGMISVGLFLLAYPLVEGRDAGWPLWAYLCLILSIPVLAIFILYERWKSGRDGSPLLELSLFRDRAFVVGLLITLFFYAGLPAFFLVFTLYLQSGLQFTALAAGLTFTPFGVGFFISSTLSAKLASKLGSGILKLGALMMTSGLLLLIAIVNSAGISLRGYELIPALLVYGAGQGFVTPSLFNIILAGIQSSNAGSASGVCTTVQQISSAIGVAAIGIIFFGLLGSQADTVSANLAPQLRQQLTAVHLSSSVVESVVADFRTCFHDRAKEKDPTVIPASCRQQRTLSPTPSADRASVVSAASLRAEVEGILATSIATANAQNFAAAFVTSLLYNISLLVATFLLVFLLPRRCSDNMRKRRVIQRLGVEC